MIISILSWPIELRKYLYYANLLIVALEAWLLFSNNFFLFSFRGIFVFL